MRILVASGIFSPEIGGPATYLDDVLPALSKRGHNLSVLSFGEPDLETRYPYAVLRVPRRHWLARHWDYYRSASRLWQGQDLAFVHSLGLPLPRRLRPRLARVGGDAVWERAINRGWVAPDLDIERFQDNRHHPLVRLSKALRHRELRRLDCVIVPCQSCKRLAISWGVAPSKITVIFNGVPAVRDPQGTKSEIRSRLGLPDVRLLLAVGRLTPFKGIHYLIQAVSRLNAVHLLIVGEGPSRPQLIRLADQLRASDRIHFLGCMSRDQLPVLYRAADYTILYSGGEGLSHVLLESLSAGTPVIASDKGGNSEIVEHGENGWLARYPDEADLLRIMEQAFSAGEQCRCAANTGTGLEKFSLENMVRQTVQLVESFERP